MANELTSSMHDHGRCTEAGVHTFRTLAFLILRLFVPEQNGTRISRRQCPSVMYKLVIHRLVMKPDFVELLLNLLFAHIHFIA